MSIDTWGLGWGMLALAIAWYSVEKMKHKKYSVHVKCDDTVVDASGDSPEEVNKMIKIAEGIKING
jgi:hypothetical protein